MLSRMRTRGKVVLQTWVAQYIPFDPQMTWWQLASHWADRFCWTCLGSCSPLATWVCASLPHGSSAYRFFCPSSFEVLWSASLIAQINPFGLLSSSRPLFLISQAAACSALQLWALCVCSHRLMGGSLSLWYFWGKRALSVLQSFGCVVWRSVLVVWPSSLSSLWGQFGSSLGCKLTRQAVVFCLHALARRCRGSGTWTTQTPFCGTLCLSGTQSARL